MADRIPTFVMSERQKIAVVVPAPVLAGWMGMPEVTLRLAAKDYWNSHFRWDRPITLETVLVLAGRIDHWENRLEREARQPQGFWQDRWPVALLEQYWHGPDWPPSEIAVKARMDELMASATFDNRDNLLSDAGAEHRRAPQFAGSRYQNRRTPDEPAPVPEPETPLGLLLLNES